MQDFVKPMLTAETQMLREADAIHAISGAIAAEVEAAYHTSLDPSRTFIVPLGLEDWTELPREVPRSVPGTLRLLFVGRLEARKGIDVLLRAMRPVLRDHPHVRLDLVGNDTIADRNGVTYRDMFLNDAQTESLRTRVFFHGQVSEERLRGFYAACDILVTPSRFESFGLMLLEGMMFGKPVIGCRAGGMTEVVEEGVSGLLAEPGDESSLHACLERLVGDAELRARLGANARARFFARFSEGKMVRNVLAILSACDAKRAESAAPAAA